MLASLSAQEITDWMVYEAMEPFGEAAAYQRHAMLLATLVNVLQQRKRVDQVTPEDFMPETMLPKTNEVKSGDSPIFAIAKALGRPVIKVDTDG